MKSGDIVVIRTNTDNFKQEVVEGTDIAWTINLHIAIDNYEYKNTYIIKVNFDIQLCFNCKRISLSTYTDFAVFYLEFNKQLFFAKENDYFVDIVTSAYSHARMLFHSECQAIPGFEDIYLPYKTNPDIKHLIIKTDIYNKL